MHLSVTSTLVVMIEFPQVSGVQSSSRETTPALSNPSVWILENEGLAYLPRCQSFLVVK